MTDPVAFFLCQYPDSKKTNTHIKVICDVRPAPVFPPDFFRSLRTVFRAFCRKRGLFLFAGASNFFPTLNKTLLIFTELSRFCSPSGFARARFPYQASFRTRPDEKHAEQFESTRFPQTITNIFIGLVEVTLLSVFLKFITFCVSGPTIFHDLRVVCCFDAAFALCRFEFIRWITVSWSGSEQRTGVMFQEFSIWKIREKSVCESKSRIE